MFINETINMSFETSSISLDFSRCLSINCCFCRRSKEGKRRLCSNFYGIISVWTSKISRDGHHWFLSVPNMCHFSRQTFALSRQPSMAATKSRKFFSITWVPQRALKPIEEGKQLFTMLLKMPIYRFVLWTLIEQLLGFCSWLFVIDNQNFLQASSSIDDNDNTSDETSSDGLCARWRGYLFSHE